MCFLSILNPADLTYSISNFIASFDGGVKDRRDNSLDQEAHYGNTAYYSKQPLTPSLSVPTENLRIPKYDFIVSPQAENSTLYKNGDSGDHDLKSGIDTQVSFVLAINLSPSKIDTSTSFVPKYSNDTVELS